MCSHIEFNVFCLPVGTRFQGGVRYRVVRGHSGHNGFRPETRLTYRFFGRIFTETLTCSWRIGPKKDHFFISLVPKRTNFEILVNIRKLVPSGTIFKIQVKISKLVLLGTLFKIFIKILKNVPKRTEFEIFTKISKLVPFGTVFKISTKKSNIPFVFVIFSILAKGTKMVP